MSLINCNNSIWCHLSTHEVFYLLDCMSNKSLGSSHVSLLSLLLNYGVRILEDMYI